jgi:hypothetical protein
MIENKIDKAMKPIPVPYEAQEFRTKILTPGMTES